jgi:hypothetical protein
MGTYDTRGGHPLHNPMFDYDPSTQLQEDVLEVLEKAEVETAVCDRIVEIIAEWERRAEPPPNEHTKGDH